MSCTVAGRSNLERKWTWPTGPLVGRSNVITARSRTIGSWAAPMRWIRRAVACRNWESHRAACSAGFGREQEQPVE